MQPKQPENILTFLAGEHENELVSTLQCARDIEWLAHIDGIYKAPVKHFDIPIEQQAIAQLYLFIHYHLYTSISNLMRMHISDALGCERKAIDAALSAYEMLTDSSSIPAYKAREWKFLSIKSYIEKARKKDASKYPLAVELLKTWDMCSEFGAHADESTFIHRINQVPVAENPDQAKLYFLYFQIPTTVAETRMYYVDTFVNFLTISRIFDSFIKDYAKGLPFEEWVKERDAVEAATRKELAHIHLQLEKQDAIAQPNA